MRLTRQQTTRLQQLVEVLNSNANARQSMCDELWLLENQAKESCTELLQILGHVKP